MNSLKIFSALILFLTLKGFSQEDFTLFEPQNKNIALLGVQESRLLNLRYNTQSPDFPDNYFVYFQYPFANKKITGGLRINYLKVESNKFLSVSAGGSYNHIVRDKYRFRYGINFFIGKRISLPTLGFAFDVENLVIGSQLRLFKSEQHTNYYMDSYVGYKLKVLPNFHFFPQIIYFHGSDNYHNFQIKPYFIFNEKVWISYFQYFKKPHFFNAEKIRYNKFEILIGNSNKPVKFGILAHFRRIGSVNNTINLMFSYNFNKNLKEQNLNHSYF